jgi:DNA-binding protein HU-beta
MNQTQFVAAFAEQTGMSKADAKTTLLDFQTVVRKALKKGDPVTLTGFAKFARVDRPARMGRNPATGETIKIKAKRVVRITPLKAFKDEIMASKK